MEQTYLYVAVLLYKDGTVAGQSIGRSEEFARADCERWAAVENGNYATLHRIPTQSGERFGGSGTPWVLDRPA